MISERAEQQSDGFAQCASEPIRIPGAIQPHGVLLTLSDPTLIISQISINCLELFGVDALDILHRPLAALVGVPYAEMIRQALALRDLAEGNPLRLCLRNREFNGQLSRLNGLVVLELELEQAPEADRDNGIQIMRSMRRMQAATTLEDLYAGCVSEIQTLTGYSRVMIYRFEPEGHGRVIGQALRGTLPDYMGLYFPASDIPPQARELYRQNWLRVIPDATYIAVPITPEFRPDTGEPLDLGFSSLRSVSPVHCEYLKNMGVRSSMSLSLLVKDQLWGLITCGHPEALYISHATRSVCAVIAQLLSVQITALLAEELQSSRREKLLLLDALADSMNSSEADVFDGLIEQPEALMALTGASGVAVLIDDRLHVFGLCPTPLQVRALYPWVRLQCLQDSGVDEQGERKSMGVTHSHQLASDYPLGAAYKGIASGLLAIVLPKPVDNAIIWFRPQITSTMKWGGAPASHTVLDPEQSEGYRLSPRKSFAIWEQQVEGKSRKWSASDTHAANELRRFATENDLARQVRRGHAAVRDRDELVAVVSHDLRNPMTIVIMQCGVMQRLVADDTSKESRRLNSALNTVRLATAQMTRLVTDLVDTSVLESGHYQIVRKHLDVVEVLEDACALVIDMTLHKRIELNCACSAGLKVHADPERLFQVLSNLLGNALKFTREAGQIDLNAWRQGDEVLISIKDNGPGIDRENLSHIFERYWTVRAGNPTGSGLGLYICKGIVEAHGGKLWAESEVGQGCRFTFSIPFSS